MWEKKDSEAYITDISRDIYKIACIDDNLQQKVHQYLLVNDQPLLIYTSLIFGDSFSHSDFFNKLRSVIRHCYFVVIQNKC